MITENLAEVFPEAGAYDENGRDANAIDYRQLVALLIEAVKEHQVQIRNQEPSLKVQRGQLAKLRGEIERIKISITAAGVR